MPDYFTLDNSHAIPISVVTIADYQKWLDQQVNAIKAWLTTTQYKNEPSAVRLIADDTGNLARVVICIADKAQFYQLASLPMQLPENTYYFDLANDDSNLLPHYALAWGLGSYQFSRYKKPTRNPAKLFVKDASTITECENHLAAITLVRDLINTPTDDMGPSEFTHIAQQVAKQYTANFTELKGEVLLTANYPAIYTVGRASDDAPRLLDLKWGNIKHPKVTLVGKGVCFDTGGLDLKPSSAMLLMKKDMGGAAHVLGLAQMIMTAKLPICLRVLMPVVENAVAGNAYRPGDVIKSRKGLTIEIGNTDAEGRVILADALYEASCEKPDLIIDIATLTGAARVALGTDLPAVFCNQDAMINELLMIANEVQDPMWRLPLHAPYRESLNSNIADINNNSADSYAGAITAALFLQEFIDQDIPWLHFDLMAWNLRARPGKPIGGEAMVIRALYAYLRKRYLIGVI